MFSARFIVLNLLLLQESLCEKKKIYCSFEDNVCLTKNAQNPYLDVITGAYTGINSDPLQIDVIKPELPNIRYTLHNAKLTGLSKCNVIEVKFNIPQLNYTYGIKCPLLTTEADYEVSGTLNNVAMNGKGKMISTHENYYVTYNINYEKKVDGENKLHVHFTDSTIDLEAKGKVTYEYKNLFDGDAKKSEEFHTKFSKENWKTLDESLGNASMKAFFYQLLENANKYMEKVEIETTYYYYE